MALKVSITDGDTAALVTRARWVVLIIALGGHWVTAKPRSNLHSTTAIIPTGCMV